LLVLGDATNARKEYESFLTLRVDADSSVPLLTQTQAEYGAIT
jgi:hypothetical protein